MTTPGEMAAVMRRAAARVVPELENVVEKTMVRAMFVARDKVGHYQPGWPALSLLTYDRGTQGPLLRSGALRDSFYVEQRGLTGMLVSDAPYIVYSELGTSHEPPLPLLKESVREAAREEGMSRLRFVTSLLLR